MEEDESNQRRHWSRIKFLKMNIEDEGSEQGADEDDDDDRQIEQT